MTIEPTPPTPPTPAADPADAVHPAPGPDAEGPAPTRGVSEDWAATIVGLALVVLVLAGVIGKGLVP